MKTQHLIPILILAAFCTVSAQTNTTPANTNAPSLVVLASLPRYMVYTDTKREPKGSITTWSSTNSEDSIIFYLHNNISDSNWVVKIQLSEGTEIPVSTLDEREPKGSHDLFFLPLEKYGSTNGNARYNPNILFYYHNSVSGANWIRAKGINHGISFPYVIMDRDMGVTFEVEADGRHISATDMYGALIWYRDPYADAHLSNDWTNKPQIRSFEIMKRKPSEDWTIVEGMLGKKGVNAFINITFNSAQGGFMDIRTGEFHVSLFHF